MAYEVVNTSVVRGLTSGHSGYCDVIRTRGLPEEITPLLAPLNFYNEKLARGKAACGVRTIRFGGRVWGIVSRVVPNGNDYTGRPNRLAHHVIAPPSELKTLCPVTILAEYTFRDTFTEVPRYMDREPLISETTQKFDHVWEFLGGEAWRSHIANLALSGSRVVLFIPPSVDGRDVLISILLGIPVERRWEIGVVEASSAEQCWAHHALIRILTLSEADACVNQSWPGEVVLDLRHRPTPPSKFSAPGKQVATKNVVSDKDTIGKPDFTVFGASAERRSSIEIDKPSHPIVVNIDFSPVLVGESEPDALPARIRLGSSDAENPILSAKLITFWLLVGAMFGAIVGLFIVKLK